MILTEKGTGDLTLTLIMEGGALTGLKKSSKIEKMPYSRIESIGVMEPSGNLTTKELLKKMKHKISLDLERLTGIHQRKMCLDGEDSYSLGLGAAKDCLKHSKYSGNDLGMVIWTSISRSYLRDTVIYEPTLSLRLKNDLGSHKAINFDISNACAGMMTGVYILNDFITNGVVKNGMVISGEYITPISSRAQESVRSIASPQLASLTVGDVGAAVILERNDDGSQGLKMGDFVTLSEFSDLCMGRPCKTKTGAIMKTKARKIHKVAINESPPIVEKSLKSAKIRLDNIDYIVPHQTSERAIRSGFKSISRKWGVTPKNVIINLTDYGNTASTTHFLALYRNLKERKFKKGDKIMLLCFASGLVVGTIFFTMDGLVTAYEGSN